MTLDTRADRAAPASAFLPGKDERLEVLNEKPLVISTPPGLLAGYRITPNDKLFVRNIQDRAEAQTLEPQSVQGWEIELVGLIDPLRLVVQAEELLEIDQVEHEMVLQCSGNGRAGRARRSLAQTGCRHARRRCSAETVLGPLVLSRRKDGPT